MQPSVVPGRAYQPADRRSGLLFHWSPAALGLKPFTKELPTFARAGISGALVDRLGRYGGPAVHSQPAFDLSDEDGDGIFERPWCVLEPAGDNLVLRSEDFGTTWTPVGTPTRTAAAIVLGRLVLDLIGDDNGAAHEYYGQPITFTGNGVKVVSVRMARGPAPAGAGAMVWIRDTTAVADRLLAAIQWNADGSPNVAAPATGVFLEAVRLGTDALGRIVYEIFFQTTAVTAANGHEVRVGATQATATEQGDVYAGGVHAENADLPSSYVATLGSTVPRPVATLSWGTTIAVQALSLYGMVRPRYPLSVAPASEQGWAAVGDDFTGEAVHVAHNTANELVAYHGSGGGSVTSVASLASLVRPLEYLVTLYPDGAIEAAVRDATGTVRRGAKSVARPFTATAFQGAKLHLGARGTLGLAGRARYGPLKVRPGAVTDFDLLARSF